MNLILKALLLPNNETEKQPSASVNPVNQLSFRVGNIVVEIGKIVGKLFLASFRFKFERNIRNLVLPTGNTLLPLNNKQINSKFFKSWTINRCVCCTLD
jgi:hypothetical protein